jgi:hypothetical protein
VANVECPEESLDWFQILRTDLHNHEQHFLVVSDLLYKISLLCPRIRRTIDHGSFEEVSFLLPILLAEADAIENDILTWTRSNTTFSRSPAGYLPRLHILNVFRGARSKLQHLLLSLFNHVEKFPHLICDPLSLQRRRYNSVSIVRAMAQEILDSVAYALGDPITTLADDVPPRSSPRCWADALRLVWPLAIVSWSPIGLHHQTEMARAALERIGQNMGIRLALRMISRSELE